MSISRPQASSWELLLDELEDRAALAATAPESYLSPWIPPDDIGPIPAGSLRRVELILAATEQVVAQVDHARAAVERDMLALSRRSSRAVGHPASGTFDLSV